MNAVLSIEHRFRRDKKGNVYSSSNSVNRLLWERYLQVFDSLTVFARIEDVTEEISENYLVNHKLVTFVGVPYYHGPKQFIYNYIKIKTSIRNIVSKNDAYICRLPSIIGTILISYLKQHKIPYLVELVGDPWELYAPGSLNTPLSYIHRFRSYWSLKNNVRGACGVIYVTEKKLQRRYPANKNAVTTHASNVILSKRSIEKQPKKVDNFTGKFKIVSIGSLEQLYKSPDVVLEALVILKNKGYNPELVWLGDGKYKKDLINRANQILGLADCVEFKGNVSSHQIRTELKSSNIYVHASRTEGLPRAIIEAMATGLPCIGTRVGGIPELLDDNVLVDKNSPEQLADKIIWLIDNKEIANIQAAKNLSKAKEFEFDILAARRNKVYAHLIRNIK